MLACVCVCVGGGGGCVHTCACMRAGDSVSAVRVFLFQCVSVSLCFFRLSMSSNV